MSQPPVSESKDRPYDPLPPVQPPSASFLLQLFLIPLLIVIIIVVVWLLFSWLAHMGTNPQQLVRDIGKMNNASWQRAYNLAELMRKPQYEHLKDDRELARELAATLTSLRESRPERRRDAEKETDETRRQRNDSRYENRIKLEVFLCRVLGEFRVTDGLPALIEAAKPDGTNDPESFAVRSAALLAIAVQAGELDPTMLQENEELMQAVLDASRAMPDGSYGKEEYDKLRSAAAYTLGMVGGDQSRDRLAQMLDDPDVNTRYNAATGLARHGDVRAMEVLGEMLDPDNTEALADPDATLEEHKKSGAAWKRALVLENGIRAAALMTERNPQADYKQLVGWLKRIESHKDVTTKVQLQAKDLRLKIE